MTAADSIDNGLGPSGEGQEPLAYLARYREASYRLLGGAFAYPDAERVSGLQRAAGDLWEERNSLARFAFFPSLRAAVRALREGSETQAAELPSKYLALFAASRGAIACPPYESSYRTPPGESAGWLLAQVEHAYGQAGMNLASEGHELPDHISIELEFMAVLCGREAVAWERENTRVADHVLASQLGFIEAHLTRWLPRFRELLREADADGLYCAAATAADALTCHDSEYVAALREMIATAPDAPATGGEHEPRRPDRGGRP